MSITVTTHRTGTRRVARVYQNNGYTRQLRFVRDFLPEIVERPAMQIGTLRLSNRYPGADALKVFQGDAATSALSLFDQSLADRVVGIAGETIFSTCQFFQAMAGGFRALALQFATQTAVTVTHAVDCASRMPFAIAVGSDIDNAQINPQRALYVPFVWLVHRTGRQQVEFATHVSQIAFALLVVQQFPLALSAHERDAQASAHRPDRDGLRRQSPVENAVIIGNGAVRLEHPPGFLITSVGIRDLRDTANRYLSSQSIALTNGIIQRLVQGILPKALLFPGVLADGVARSIRYLKRLQEIAGLFVVGEQLHLGNQFHATSVAQNVRSFNSLNGGMPHSSLAFKRGSPAVFSMSRESDIFNASHV